MYLDQRDKFVRTDIWREGKWLDLWSVIHFLSGITIGFFPRYLGLKGFSAYAIVFLLLVLYEMFEALAKIEETPQNRVMDVVVGIASFVPIYHFNSLLSPSTNLIFCFVFLAVTSVLSFVGWHASKKAAVFEANLREEIARGRAKIKERKTRRQLRRVNRRILKEARRKEKEEGEI